MLESSRVSTPRLVLQGQRQQWWCMNVGRGKVQPRAGYPGWPMQKHYNVSHFILKSRSYRWEPGANDKWQAPVTVPSRGELPFLLKGGTAAPTAARSPRILVLK